jgi:hypothetical protein
LLPRLENLGSLPPGHVSLYAQPVPEAADASATGHGDSRITVTNIENGMTVMC